MSVSASRIDAKRLGGGAGVLGEAALKTPRGNTVHKEKTASRIEAANILLRVME
ncbi:MAG: hypothetical protein ACLQNE_18315 [Thermoguttaceae bacterium]